MCISKYTILNNKPENKTFNYSTVLLKSTMGKDTFLKTNITIFLDIQLKLRARNMISSCSFICMNANKPTFSIFFLV